MAQAAMRGAASCLANPRSRSAAACLPAQSSLVSSKATALLLAMAARVHRPALDKATGISLPFTLAGSSSPSRSWHAVLRDYGRSGLRSMNRRMEDAPQPGGETVTVFRRVTLPLIWPSLAAGTC